MLSCPGPSERLWQQKLCVGQEAGKETRNNFLKTTGEFLGKVLTFSFDKVCGSQKYKNEYLMFKNFWKPQIGELCPNFPKW